MEDLSTPATAYRDFLAEKVAFNKTYGFDIDDADIP